MLNLQGLILNLVNAWLGLAYLIPRKSGSGLWPVPVWLLAASGSCNHSVTNWKWVWSLLVLLGVWLSGRHTLSSPGSYLQATRAAEGTEGLPQHGRLQLFWASVLFSDRGRVAVPEQTLRSLLAAAMRRFRSQWDSPQRWGGQCNALFYPLTPLRAPHAFPRSAQRPLPDIRARPSQRPPSQSARPRAPRPANELSTRSGGHRMPAAGAWPKTLHPPPSGRLVQPPWCFSGGRGSSRGAEGSERLSTVRLYSQMLGHLLGQEAKGLVIRTFRRGASGSYSSAGRRGSLCAGRAGEEGDYRSQRAARDPLSSLALRGGAGCAGPGAAGSAAGPQWICSETCGAWTSGRYRGCARGPRGSHPSPGSGGFQTPACRVLPTTVPVSCREKEQIMKERD